jgi:hypothetical protein
MLLIPGMLSSVFCNSSWINPPITAVCPLLTLMMDSISRRCSCGIRFGTTNEGLGSLTNERMRVSEGRKLSSTVSFSPICGVTLMTKPTATVLTVVLTDTVAPVVVGGPRGGGIDLEINDVVHYSQQCSLIIEHRKLGLERTRTLPKDSRRRMVAARFPNVEFGSWILALKMPFVLLVMPFPT